MIRAALMTWLAEHDRLRADALGQLDAASPHRALVFSARAAASTGSRRGANLPRRHQLD